MLLRLILLDCCNTGDELNFRSNCWPDGDIGEPSDVLILTVTEVKQNKNKMNCLSFVEIVVDFLFAC